MENYAITSIGNYYGCLNIRKENGACYWTIENHGGFRWERIPETLYNELKKMADHESDDPLYWSATADSVIIEI